MRRREVITLLGGAAAAWPFRARAQPPKRVLRIGVLTGYLENDPVLAGRIAAFVQALQALGWTVGRNVTITYRHAGSDNERLQAAARELAAIAPDVIVVHSNPGVMALRHINPTIPAVFVMVGEPVGSGFVDSLSRPGGQLTGFTTMEPEMGGKWLELLKEAAPAVTRAAVILQPDIAANLAYFRATEVAGATLKVATQAIGVHDAAGIERAVATFAQEPNGGLIVVPSPVTTRHRELLGRLSVAHRLPQTAAFRSNVTSGGLMCYGPDAPDLFRRAASYVDRILRGEKPANLPVQVPTKFELIINLATAKALGLEIPPTLLARADEVIE